MYSTLNMLGYFECRTECAIFLNERYIASHMCETGLKEGTRMGGNLKSQGLWTIISGFLAAIKKIKFSFYSSMLQAFASMHCSHVIGQAFGASFIILIQGWLQCGMSR